MKLKKRFLIGITTLPLLALLIALFFKINEQKQALNRMNINEMVLIQQQDSLKEILAIYNQRSVADEFFIEGLIDLLTKEMRDSITLHHTQMSNYFPDLTEVRISQATRLKAWKNAQRKQLTTLNQNYQSLKGEYDYIHALKDSTLNIVEHLVDSLIGFKKDLLLLYSQLSELDSIHKINLDILEIGQNGQTVYYIGEKQNGLAHGFGVGLWSTGSIYKGFWQNNLRHGHGWYRWKDGELYEGSFKEGMRTGEGTYYWKDKTYYQGEWLNNFRHGFGSVYYPDGTLQYEGMWENDKFLPKEKK
jgi:hypothetical protein